MMPFSGAESALRCPGRRRGRRDRRNSQANPGREVGFSGTEGDTEDYTFLGVDLRRGNLVVRGNCLLLSVDTEFEESCLEYFGALVRRLELLEPGP